MQRFNAPAGSPVLLRAGTIAIAVLAFVTTAGASEFFLQSPRAIGLGGAYTALATGPDALFWNPAGLSYPNKTSFSYSQSGFHDDSENMEDPLDTLRRINPESPLIYDSPGTAAQVAADLLDLDGSAARRFEGWQVVAAGDKWALGFGDYQQGVLKAVADPLRIAAVPPDQPASIANNESSVDSYQMDYQRYSVALSLLTPQDPFTFGATVNYHRGGTRFARTRVFEVPSKDPIDLIDLADRAPELDSDDWSFDLGLMVPTKKFRVGVVAKNLFFDPFPIVNPPAGSEFNLDMSTQVRVGVGYLSDKSLTGIDIDVTNNPVLGADRKTRELALGYERWVSGWIALRSGTSIDFDDGGRGLTFALGTSIRLPFLSLDIGGRLNREGGFDEIVGGATLSF